MKFFYKTFLLAVAAIVASCTTDADDEWSASEVCPESKRGTFVDERDGQVYKYTTIGKQVWMAQNLNYEVEGSSCEYDDGCKDKGRRYFIGTALYSCPAGWRVPSHEDWFPLFEKMGGIDIAGLRLKSSSSWMIVDGEGRSNGTDDCGFSVLPLKPNAKVSRDGIQTRLMSSTMDKSAGGSSYLRFTSHEDRVYAGTESTSENKIYVRCIKN